MSLLGVNTNVGAATALRYMGETREALATTERRLSTGRRVASVRDNGALWTIAQQQRGDGRSIEVIKSGLQRAKSIVDVAVSSGEAISDLLVQMKETALAATDSGLGADSRATLDRAFGQLRDQVTRVLRDGHFDNVSLINDTAGDFAVTAGLATVTTVGPPRPHPQHPGRMRPGITTTGPSTLEIAAERFTLGGAIVTVAGTDALTDEAASKSAATKADASIKNLSSALTRLAASSRQIDRQHLFLGKLQDGLTAGVGNLVDADLGRESARLQALQTREQLGIQALGIANGAPKVLLGLFR